MAEEIKQPVLRPQFKLSRDEIANAVEGMTGQKPKDGFHSVTLTMGMDGNSGNLTWVDAANLIPSLAPPPKKIPPAKKANGNTPKNG